WHTIDVVLNGTTGSLYLDGQLINSQTITQVSADPSSIFVLGQYSTGSSGYGAYGFDQLTISNVARSASWVQAEYESQLNNLITYGPQESANTPSGVNVSGSGGTAAISWGAVTGASQYQVFESTTPGGENYSDPIATINDGST